MKENISFCYISDGIINSIFKKLSTEVKSGPNFDHIRVLTSAYTCNTSNSEGLFLFILILLSCIISKGDLKHNHEVD